MFVICSSFEHSTSSTITIIKHHQDLRTETPDHHLPSHHRSQRSPKPPSSHEPNDTPTDLHITTPWHIRRFKFGTEMDWLHREGELRGVGSQVISQVCRANSNCGRSQYQLPTFFDTKKLNYTLGLSIIVIFWLFSRIWFSTILIMQFLSIY